ncbi:MAG: asparagine synthase-related protein [Thermoanaerobaculaceae bacterium]
MSGILAVVRRDGAPLDPGDLDASSAALTHRGPDGGDAAVLGDRALLHHHFWTTPEEIGERQPIRLDGDRLLIALDGRIDNRNELLAQLAPGEATISDAVLVARAYECWGEGCFARLLGPLAACVFDHRTGRVVLARDPLGDRTLFYHLSDRLLVVASEEAAVLAQPEVPHRLDETTLARFYAVEAPAAGATFFSEVRELPPGHTLVVGSDHAQLRAFWSPPDGPMLRLRSDREYADAFRGLLRDAVHCRMRSPRPVGVLMSGGLDSTSVACLAAEEMARASRGEPLGVFSWVFDELACDERLSMDAVIERYGLEALRIVGDTLWPLRDASAWPYDPGRPHLGIYRLLLESLCREIKATGTDVLLTGNFGDHLYSGAERWLLDLLRERRFAAAAGSLLSGLIRRGPGQLWSDPGLRYSASRTLQPLKRQHRLDGTPTARKPWLTAAALDRISRAESYEQDGLDEVGGRFRLIATPWAAQSAPLGTSQANRLGIEIRNPYRDRRLVEFMASVPRHQVYRGGLNKHILREAMRGTLPDRVRLRKNATSYIPLYKRGFFERERATVRALLGVPDAWWPRFVRREWLESAVREPVGPRNDGAAALVPWFCVVAELWRLTASLAELTYLKLP